jgi:hypothetical protein
MRVFKRDQRPGGVVHALGEGEADRLLAQEPERQAAQPAKKLAAAGRTRRVYPDTSRATRCRWFSGATA